MIDEGNALEEQGRISEAMAHYNAAAQADPQFARAPLNRGNIFLARAQFDEALGAYQLAIACDPKYAAAYFNLGKLNYRARDLQRALDNYQIAISLRSDFADARSWQREMHLTLSQIESFISESGLHFIGFELDHRILNHYRARFPDDASGINLGS